MRISRQYLATEQQGEAHAQTSLEPPTPEKLFQQIWDKNGYSTDDTVLKDFLSLIQDAEKSLEDEQHN